MKKVKTILSIVILFVSFSTLSAQKKTLEAKATEKINAIDMMILSEDKNLGLNAEQKEKMIAYQEGMLKEIQKIQKEGLAEDKKKEKLKLVYKKAYKEMIVGMMDKEQQNALKVAKQKIKKD